MAKLDNYICDGQLTLMDWLASDTEQVEKKQQVKKAEPVADEIKPKRQTVTPERFKHWIGADYIPSIIDTILNGSLLEYVHNGLIDGLKDTKLLADVYDRKPIYKLIKNTLFKYSNTFFFYADGELFGLKIHMNDKPNFLEDGIAFIYHCGDDNAFVLGNLCVSDILFDFKEAIEREGREQDNDITDFIPRHTC